MVGGQTTTATAKRKVEEKRLTVYGDVAKEEEVEDGKPIPKPSPQHFLDSFVNGLRDWSWTRQSVGNLRLAGSAYCLGPESRNGLTLTLKSKNESAADAAAHSHHLQHIRQQPIHRKRVSREKKNKSIFFYSFPFYFLSAIECVEHFPSQMRLVSNSTAIAFYIVFLYSEMNFWHRSVHIIVERDLFSYLMSSTYSNISISRQEIEKVRLINFDFATYLNAMSTPKKWIGSIARSKLPAARWVGVDPWCSWRCVGS